MASSSSKDTTSRRWSALDPPLSKWVIDWVAHMGFERMTPVQANTISLFLLRNKDVVVEAVTGSGKTLSFLIPVVERLFKSDEPFKKHHVASIIVSPTRELASQTYSVLQSLLTYCMASVTPGSCCEELLESRHGARIVPQLLVGGILSPAQDLNIFLDTSPQILVSTPGRLLDLLSSSRVKCPQTSFSVLILDEADRLLDLGFKDELQRILAKLPKQRRTGLFSASMSEAVEQLVRVGLRNPVKIAVKVKGVSGRMDQKIPASLQLRYLALPASCKIPALCEVLSTIYPSPVKTIVYLSTCAAVDYFQHVLAPVLKRRIGNVSLLPLHGKHPPLVRQKNFLQFSNAHSPTILLTTDVAARGLDIPQVDLVVQMDPPSDPANLVHRSGRAGRAGRKGLAVVFLHAGREEDYVHLMDVRKTPITPLVSPTVAVGPTEATAIVEQIRNIVIADRALHDKAQRGFVSWVRSYSKHQASSIFRISDLDWHDLASAWGLLKMPNMPELRQWDGDKSLGLGIDFSRYQYKDCRREEARRTAILEVDVSRLAHIKLDSTKKRAWSGKYDRKDEKERRKIRKHQKREKEEWSRKTPEERRKQADLESLIEQIKYKSDIDDGEFHGFSDS